MDPVRSAAGYRLARYVGASRAARISRSPWTASHGPARSVDVRSRRPDRSPAAQFGDKALQGSYACFEVVVHSDVLADLALGRILLADSIELDGGAGLDVRGEQQAAEGVNHSSKAADELPALGNRRAAWERRVHLLSNGALQHDHAPD